MATATEEHHSTQELEAELEEVRAELRAKRVRNSGWHLLALFAFVIGAAALVAVTLGANDKQIAVSAMHKQMNSQLNGNGAGVMGAGSGMMGAGPAATSSKPAAGPADQVKAQLGDYWVKPSTTSVPAGKVTFTATNVGQVPHELMIERAPIKMDAPGQPNEDAAQGMIEDMDPGQSGSMTLNLQPGSYMLFCNVPGHFMMGQHTMFKVTG
jgi:uncharacterized cupredoxin-like copper-binding protein